MIIGKRVLVVFSNQAYASNENKFPPVGTCGVVLSEFDLDGECDVDFDDYPCINTPLDPSWITHKNMIVFLDGKKPTAKLKKETILETP